MSLPKHASDKHPNKDHVDWEPDLHQSQGQWFSCY